MCGGGGGGLKIKLSIPGRAVFDFERSTLLYHCTVSLFNNFCSQELLELGIIPKEDCVLQMVCTFLYCVYKIYIKM